MDKKFWLSICTNDYAPPEGKTASGLMPELLTLLGSTDSELRDDVAYMILATWLDRGLYSPDEMRGFIDPLCTNLKTGLGELVGDQIFLRTFSVLILAELVHHDNKQPFLEETDLRRTLAEGLAYFRQEKDLRGYVPEKGWAHSAAHTADLLMVLARNRGLGADDLLRLLQAITEKLTFPAALPLLYMEDERLVRAVMAIWERCLLSPEEFGDWLDSLAASTPVWRETFSNEPLRNAYQNTRLFLASLILQLERAQVDSGLIDMARSAMKSINPFYA